MYMQLNRLELLSKYAKQIKLFSYSFNSTEEIDGGIIAPIKDEPERVSALIDSVDPEQLRNLTIAKVFRIFAISDVAMRMWQQPALAVGADEATEFLVLYELEGNFYLGGFHLLRYENAWRIDQLVSITGGTSALGIVDRMTLEEFEEHIAWFDNENVDFEEIQ
jgi:hypothetical protein